VRQSGTARTRTRDSSARQRVRARVPAGVLCVGNGLASTRCDTSLHNTGTPQPTTHARTHPPTHTHTPRADRQCCARPNKARARRPQRGGAVSAQAARTSHGPSTALIGGNRGTTVVLYRLHKSRARVPQAPTACCPLPAGALHARPTQRHVQAPCHTPSAQQGWGHRVTRAALDTRQSEDTPPQCSSHPARDHPGHQPRSRGRPRSSDAVRPLAACHAAPRAHAQRRARYPCAGAPPHAAAGAAAGTPRCSSLLKAAAKSCRVRACVCVCVCL
jgi:hypothetical protein